MTERKGPPAKAAGGTAGGNTADAGDAAPQPAPAEAGVSLGGRIARLEQILGRLEREDLELEEALALFEEGVKHVREAERLLRVAELRVERLLERADGSVDTRPVPDAP